MDEAWTSQFRHRMRTFGAAHPHDGPGINVSLKVRVTAGCFHREHSPNAYSLIDAHLAARPTEDAHLDFLEHESGPEVLVYLAAGTAGLALAKSVIDLVVAIIAARREGIRQGDRPSEPIELIVRRVEHDDAIVEETVLRVGHRDPLHREQVEELVETALERFARTDQEDDD